MDTIQNKNWTLGTNCAYQITYLSTQGERLASREVSSSLPYSRKTKTKVELEVSVKPAQDTHSSLSQSSSKPSFIQALSCSSDSLNFKIDQLLSFMRLLLLNTEFIRIFSSPQERNSLALGIFWKRKKVYLLTLAVHCLGWLELLFYRYKTEK